LIAKLDPLTLVKQLSDSIVIGAFVVTASVGAGIGEGLGARVGADVGADVGTSVELDDGALVCGSVGGGVFRRQQSYEHSSAIIP